ncbi:MAG: SPFH domain-containing protein [Patescibacteria group bacterium]
MLWVIVAILTIAFILYGIIVVPTANYGILVRMGKRVDGDPLPEGWHWIIPFFYRVEAFSYELKTTDLTVKVTAREGVGITINATIQWRPDEEHMKRYYEVEDKDIITGLQEAVKNEIGVISGVHNASEFIEKRGAIGDLINCLLRLKDMPHITFRWPKKYGSGVPLPITDKTKILDHYDNHRILISKKLKATGDGSHSPIEEKYGIDIQTFSLTGVQFSPEVAEDLEKERRAQAQASALTTKTDAKITNIQKLRIAGLTAQEANVAIDVMDNRAERQVTTFEGLGGGVRPIVITNPGGTTPPKGRSKP